MITPVPQPPEGKLLRAARARHEPPLSIPEAASRARMGENYWGEVERGYKSEGKTRPARVVTAPPETLARMARAVRVSSSELRMVGRDDAAEAYELMYPVRTVEVGDAALTYAAREAPDDARFEEEFRRFVEKHRAPPG